MATIIIGSAKHEKRDVDVVPNETVTKFLARHRVRVATTATISVSMSDGPPRSISKAARLTPDHADACFNIVLDPNG